MSNMSYCRFQNTLKDLQDCSDHIFDELSKDEHKARARLIEVCYDILEEVEGADLDKLLEEENDDEELDTESENDGG